jgi:hypothetical protein
MKEGWCRCWSSCIEGSDEVVCMCGFCIEGIVSHVSKNWHSRHTGLDLDTCRLPEVSQRAVKKEAFEAGPISQQSEKAQRSYDMRIYSRDIIYNWLV